MWKRLERLSKRQTGHCVVGKVDLVPCLGPPRSIRTTQVTLGCAGKAMTVIWTPDLPNFYLANKSNVLLLVFGINTWLKSLKIWLLLPIKERHFIRAVSVWGERIGFPLYLLSASAPDLVYLAGSLSRCLNVGLRQRSCISFVDNWCNKCNNQTRYVDSWANLGVDVTALVQLEMFAHHKSVSDKCPLFLSSLRHTHKNQTILYI